MADDPSDRYSSAEAMSKALDSFIRRRSVIASIALIVLIPVVAREAGTPCRAHRRVSRLWFLARRSSDRTYRRIDSPGLVERQRT